MRTLLFVFTLIFSGNLVAQSPLLSRSFNDGTKLANAGEFEKAGKSYRTALMIAHDEEMPADYLAKVHFNLGVCNYRLGSGAAAVAELNKAIKLSRRKYPRAYYALGMAEAEQKNWPNARRAFLEAVKLNDADGEAWFDLAIVYLAEKDFDSAQMAFRNSIYNKSIDSALGHNNIGVIMAMKSDLAEAEKEFEAALIGSGGRLVEARKNLEFCRALSVRRTGLVGKVEFSIGDRGLESLL